MKDRLITYVHKKKEMYNHALTLLKRYLNKSNKIDITNKIKDIIDYYIYLATKAINDKNMFLYNEFNTLVVDLRNKAKMYNLIIVY